MPRTPYAARTLIDEVLVKHPKAKIMPGGLDGIGVYRSLVFETKPVSRWLSPLLDIVKDPRIASHEMNDKGHLVVTFTTQNAADIRTTFNLAAVERVLKGEDVQSTEPTVE